MSDSFTQRKAADVQKMSADTAGVQASGTAFERLYEIIAELRAPHGCPWDKEQTPLSLRSTLIEETFEAIDALTAQNAEHTAEELGDVFLNAVMIAYMFEQSGAFSVSDVLVQVCDKLVRRHPHVFPDSAGKPCLGTADTADKVLTQWDAIKQQVEGRAGDSVLDSVPEGFPPLLKAYKIQKKAAKKGFDWNATGAVFDKVSEELAEIKEALRHTASDADAKPFTVQADKSHNAAQLRVESEVGDLLFSVVNLSRHLGVDPSIALNRANTKFAQRFRYVEWRMKETGCEMNSAHCAEMNTFWEEAKLREPES